MAAGPWPKEHPRLLCQGGYRKRPGHAGGSLLLGAETKETGGDTYFHRDSWGRLQHASHTGTFFEVLETAIPEKNALDSLKFEDPWDAARQDQYRAWERQVHDRFAPVCGVMGLFMASYYLRGEFELLIDLKEDEPFGRALAQRVGEFLTSAGETALACTDTWDTAIWVYDELGNNKSSVLSPETFAAVYLDPYKAMVSHWRSRGATNVILHCDGNCLSLVDLLLEAGFTGIQGINPTAGMTVPAMKAKYGNKLALIGGMCNIQVLAKGTRRQIEEQVRSIVEVGKDGGVIIGTHSIDEDIPVENYDFYHSLVDQIDNTLQSEETLMGYLSKDERDARRRTTRGSSAKYWTRGMRSGATRCTTRPSGRPSSICRGQISCSRAR